MERHRLLRHRALEDGAGIAVAGEIDASNAPQFAEVLARLPCETALVDMSELEFMDGSGVHVVLDTARALQATGHTLVLVAPGYIVRRALAMLTPDGLLSAIRILDP